MRMPVPIVLEFFGINKSKPKISSPMLSKKLLNPIKVLISRLFIANRKEVPSIKTVVINAIFHVFFKSVLFLL